MPRIEPLAEVPDQPMGQLNIFKTLGKHPKVFEAFGRLGGLLLSGKGFPPRERELVILRTGWRSGSVYEWGQHVVIGRREGVTDAELRRLRTPGLDGWPEADRPLVAFADELCQTNTVTDATWAALAARFDEQQLIELTILVGFYRLVAGALNTLAVELDEGVPGWDAGD
ncbi:MAG TPA: carboxymuconolactone decarboxylase family protein [Acidimicrobiales bacterium]|nr:carboxymuconolactone decarboxylase family protein [Acidimicrobiales bacterium]